MIDSILYGYHKGNVMSREKFKEKSGLDGWIRTNVLLLPRQADSQTFLRLDSCGKEGWDRTSDLPRVGGRSTKAALLMNLPDDSEYSILTGLHRICGTSTVNLHH